MSNSLHGLRVLVTRPAHQAQMLCQLIEADGGKAVLLPTIEIADAIDQVALQTAIQALAENELAIFVSPNAVQKSVPIIQQYWQPWPAVVKVAAVGASSAQALRDNYLPVDFCPVKPFNSEGLLALSALQDVTNKRIIIFRGEGGRELLATTLRERGAKVREAIVYRRILPKLLVDVALLEKTIDIIICTSNTGLQNLLTLVGESARPWLQNMPLLVISERMAILAKTLGFVKAPLIADNATDVAIMTTLISYLNK